MRGHPLLERGQAGTVAPCGILGTAKVQVHGNSATDAELWQVLKAFTKSKLGASLPPRLAKLR